MIELIIDKIEHNKAYDFTILHVSNLPKDWETDSFLYTIRGYNTKFGCFKDDIVSYDGSRITIAKNYTIINDIHTYYINNIAFMIPKYNVSYYNIDTIEEITKKKTKEKEEDFLNYLSSTIDDLFTLFD